MIEFKFSTYIEHGKKNLADGLGISVFYILTMVENQFSVLS